MKTFTMLVLIRPDDEEGPEREAAIKITAPSEVMARRAAMEAVWFAGMLVSRFTQVQERRAA